MYLKAVEHSAASSYVERLEVALAPPWTNSSKENWKQTTHDTITLSHTYTIQGPVVILFESSENQLLLRNNNLLFWPFSLQKASFTIMRSSWKRQILAGHWTIKLCSISCIVQLCEYKKQNKTKTFGSFCCANSRLCGKFTLATAHEWETRV